MVYRRLHILHDLFLDSRMHLLLHAGQLGLQLHHPLTGAIRARLQLWVLLLNFDMLLKRCLLWIFFLFSVVCVIAFISFKYNQMYL